jgi:hypothetical protein
MKYIHHPYDIEVKPWAEILRANPQAAPEKVSFMRWLTFIVLDDPRGLLNEKGEQSILQMRRWQKLIEKFEASKPGEFIAIDDQDYDVLTKIVNTPSRSFQNATAITLACLTFVDAVLGAPSEIPAVRIIEASAHANGTSEVTASAG